MPYVNIVDKYSAVIEHYRSILNGSIPSVFPFSVTSVRNGLRAEKQFDRI